MSLLRLGALWVVLNFLVPAAFAQLGEAGEAALRKGDVDAAEKAFRSLVAKNPNDGGAHANLGVVYMRRKQWTRALAEFQTAGRLLPAVPGIRLNTGLAYYRLGDFEAAIAPFASVPGTDPASLQARFLLGLCYFLTERYGDAAGTLEPLWNGQSHNMQYLYVLGIAAGNSGKPDLEQKALGQLMVSGRDAPELHLLLGKAYLAREREADAITELSAAAQSNPKLSFVHYFLGMAYRKQNDLRRAREQFLLDAQIEPDVAFNYDMLGQTSSLLGEEQESERYFRQALALDPQLKTSYFGLAKLLKKRGKYQEALHELDKASSLDPKSASAHYLRAQILQAMDRISEARQEFAASAELRKSERDELERRISGGKVPDPDPNALYR